jgi:hypothetical protein
MPRPRFLTVRPALLGAIVIAVLLALLATAGAATASAATTAGAPHFHRGHLPAVGEIKLVKTKDGRAEVTVPVTYTQALSGHPRGLESSEVTLYVADGLQGHRAIGRRFRRIHHHALRGSGTVVDHFRLDRPTSRWLLGRPRKERGALVRIDVRHRIKPHRGSRPLYEKDASMTMASSHQARPQGETEFLVVKNDTDVPIKTASEPDLCMYTNGELGSNLQAFTTAAGRPMAPGSTVEALVQGSANLFDSAKFEAGSGRGAGEWFDWGGLEVDTLLSQMDIELTAVFAAIDLTQHCPSNASIFQILAATESGEAASMQSWVVTSETCSQGCVQTKLPTAFEALNAQHWDGEGIGPGEWAQNSTVVLEALVGGWMGTPNAGKIVQDQGLHWDRARLPEQVEEITVFDGEAFEGEEVSHVAWELSIHEGSSPAGFSG